MHFRQELTWDNAARKPPTKLSPAPLVSRSSSRGTSCMGTLSVRASVSADGATAAHVGLVPWVKTTVRGWVGSCLGSAAARAAIAMTSSAQSWE